MTAIVAFKFDNKVILAGDRMGSNGYTKQEVLSPKIFKVSEDIYIGYTSSFYMGQLLEHMFTPPEQLKSEKDDKYIFTKLVPALKKLFEDNDFGNKKDSKSKEPDLGTFLIIFKKRIFLFQGNSSMLEYDFGACGCGGDSVMSCINVGLKVMQAPITIEKILNLVDLSFEETAQVFTGVSANNDIIIVE